MNVKRGILTPNEEMVMNFFWDSEMPLSSRDILMMNDKGWGVEQISNMLRALERKQMIEFCGKTNGKSRPDGKRQPVRQFRVIVTRDQYLAQLVGSKKPDMKFLHKISAALVEDVGTEAVIEELENILKELKGKNG